MAGGRWVGTAEASERLGVTLRTLYRLVDEGQLPAYKIGRVIRIKEEDVEAFLEGARIRPGDLGHLYPESRA
jgi:excisionase family DNA binding protein